MIVSGEGTSTVKKKTSAFYRFLETRDLNNKMFAREKPHKNESNAKPFVFCFVCEQKNYHVREKTSSLNSQELQKLGVVHSHGPSFIGSPNQKRNHPLFFRFGSQQKTQTFNRRFPKNTSPENAPCEAMSAKLHGVLSNATRNQLNEGTNFGRPEGAAEISMGFYAWHWTPKKGGCCCMGPPRSNLWTSLPPMTGGTSPNLWSKKDDRFRIIQQ